MNKYGSYLNDYENISYIINSIQTTTDNQFRYKMILQELVERATPKKVKHHKTMNYTNCSICFELITVSSVNYCPKCGQALDWSDSE